MGDNPFEGSVKLYYGDSEVATGNIAEGLSFDIGDENGDKGTASVWEKNDRGGFEISFTATVENSGAAKGIYVFLEKVRERERMERKALLWAVTHGYIVKIFGISDKGEMCEMSTTRPSALRWLFRRCKFLPRFQVYDTKGIQRKIRKGKIV